MRLPPSWLKNEVLTRTQMLMVAVSGGVVSTVSFLKNLLVGAIVSVYFMATKERCAAHARKITYSLFSKETGLLDLPGVPTRWTTFSPALSGASCWIP